MCLFVFEDRRAIEMERGWETSMLCVVSFSRVRWLLFTCLSFFLSFFLFFSFFFFFFSFFLSFVLHPLLPLLRLLSNVDMRCLLRAPPLVTPSGARSLGNKAAAVRPFNGGFVKPTQSRIVPRAALKDVASAAADASGLTVKETEAAVRAAFDFIAAEVRKWSNWFECLQLMRMLLDR